MAHKNRYLFFVLTVSLMLMTGIGMRAAEAMENEDCLGCHGDSYIIEEGGQRLFIDQSRFDTTAHADVGCTTCHESVTEDHPDDGNVPSKASCSDCHDETYETYTHSAHGENAACSDCHNPHAVRGPLAMSGFDMNRQCAACHDPAETLTSHSEWLPRAELHMQAVPCVSCHTVSDDFVITLYVERTGPRSEFGVNLASHAELSQAAGGKSIQSLIDTDGNGLISLAELRAFNMSSQYDDFRLWGMITAESVVHKYDILDNRWDCTFCHASGPQAMQTSYVAFPNEDGTYTRVAVEKGAVLDALIGTPDFYMMGSTRNDTLSIIGLLIVAGGMLMPLAHGTARFLTRKNRRDH